ncbi:MAG: GHKL domain-containing protein [Ruminococcus sp.]|nr:GHKL domain-containing protein [Ruminococcus sp.]
MTIFFISLLVISKIVLVLNSCSICKLCFTSGEKSLVGKAAVLPLCIIMLELAQNSIISLLCLFFAESKNSALYIFSILSLVAQLLVLCSLVTTSKSSLRYEISKLIYNGKSLSLIFPFLVFDIGTVCLLKLKLLKDNFSLALSALIVLCVLSATAISAIISVNLAKVFFMKKVSSIKQQRRIQREHYKEIKSLTDELNSFRHDWANHIHCLHALLAAKEYSKATEYIEQLDDIKALEHKTLNTGNPVSDACLSQKLAFAGSKGISIDLNCHFSSAIDSLDLCSLLSNALDNSIEACDEINEKQIKILAYTRHDYQYIKVTNPSTPKSVDFETTKRDKSLHGIGVLNMKKLVRKYNGTFCAKNENGLFTLKIILKLDKCVTPPYRNFSFNRLALTLSKANRKQS